MPYGCKSEVSISQGNIYSDVPASLRQELTETLVHAETVRIERIISRGHCSEEGFWYDQDETEWVILLRGRARLEFAERDAKELEMGPGDYVCIAAHERHRVAWTDPNQDTVWIALYY
jgi:cupin 2 domain-containing protein